MLKTNRDAWAHNFNRNTLAENISRMIDTYNEQVLKWEHRADRNASVDDFVAYDGTKISWSRDLKLDLKRGKIAEYTEDKVRNSLYRPFTKSNLFFDSVMNEEIYSLPSIFPIPETETENRVICVGGYGRKEFAVLMSESIPDLNFYGDPQQSFSFYIYDEDGGTAGRTSPIGHWRNSGGITETSPSANGTSSIMCTVYSIIRNIGNGIRRTSSGTCRACHTHRTFGGLPKRGNDWEKIHIDYENVEEYPLAFIETPGKPLDWRVEKMRLSKDKAGIKYNDFLTLEGYPQRRLTIGLGIGRRWSG